jgi:ABC-2 type transport system permease protein
MPNNNLQTSIRLNTPRHYFTQFMDLFWMAMLNWRWSWRSTIVLGIVAPMFSIVALGAFAPQTDYQSRVYILTGNLVLALTFELMGKMTNHFAYMRVMGTLDFLATLPVKKGLLILSVITSFLVLSIPAIVTIVVAGSLILKVKLQPHPLLLVVVPFVALPLANLGALIGLITKSAESALAINRVLSLLMIIIGDVLLPPMTLPKTAYFVGWLSPATYSASVIRQTLIGPVDFKRLGIDLVALLLFSIITFLITSKRIRWSS